MGITTADQDPRELTADELDNVSGGFFPLAVMAFAVGFDIGFIGVMAFSDLD
jgi:lactobin A/cerein 7B family class IIb bacteriocin